MPETDSDKINVGQVKSFLAEPVIASVGLPYSYINIDNPGGGKREAEDCSRPKSDGLADHVNQNFFNGRKKSRFSKPFDGLKAGSH